MKDFIKFQQSRSQTDPTAKDLTEYQWEQSYDACKSSRRKLRGSSYSKRSSRLSRRDSSKSRNLSRSRSRSESSNRTSSRKVSRGSDKKRAKRSRSSSATTDAGSFKLSTGGLTLRPVRPDSAYNVLRVFIRTMAWIAMVLVGLSVAIKALNFTGTSAFLLSLLEGLLKIVGILVLKPFLEAMLDIPDIAMQQRKRKAPVALPPAELVLSEDSDV